MKTRQQIEGTFERRKTRMRRREGGREDGEGEREKTQKRGPEKGERASEKIFPFAMNIILEGEFTENSWAWLRLQGKLSG